MAWELSASPTCLPNGPASTSCLGFQRNSSPFEPSLWRLRSPLPGNGISRPEKNAPKRPADCNDAVSENEPSHRSPPIRGLSYTFRKSPVTHDCVVVDAAQIEQVSTAKFPANREINREFYRNGPCRAFLAL